jgi:hypothetical protein
MWLPTFLQRRIYFFGERTEVLAFDNSVLFDRVHCRIVGRTPSKFYNHSLPRRAIIRVYNESGAVLDTHEHAGDFKEAFCSSIAK